MLSCSQGTAKCECVVSDAGYDHGGDATSNMCTATSFDMPDCLHVPCQRFACVSLGVRRARMGLHTRVGESLHRATASDALGGAWRLLACHGVFLENPNTMAYFTHSLAYILTRTRQNTPVDAKTRQEVPRGPGGVSTLEETPMDSRSARRRRTLGHARRRQQTPSDARRRQNTPGDTTRRQESPGHAR